MSDFTFPKTPIHSLYTVSHSSLKISISKKKRESLIGQPHTKKPDCDNVDKSVLDGINGIAYEDDRQVCDLHTIKRYGDEFNSLLTFWGTRDPKSSNHRIFTLTSFYIFNFGIWCIRIVPI